MELVALAFAVITAAVHVACAVAVAADARKVAAAEQELWPFGRGAWIAATLAFGLIAASCYWLVHMSRVTRVDRLAIEPEPVRRPGGGEDDSQLTPELRRIQDRHAQRDEER